MKETLVPPKSGVRLPSPLSLAKLGFSLALGFCGGWLAYRLSLPLPWLLGALMATLIPSMGGARLQGPKHLRSLVLAIVGVFLGGGFTQDIFGHFGTWLISLGGMFITTLIMSLFGIWYCRKIAGYDRPTAWLSGLPGGLSAMTVMAPDLGADVRLVALTHGVRLVTLLVGLPLAFEVFLGIDVADAALPEPWVDAAATALSWADGVLLAACVVAGIPLARLLRLPTPIFVGPMLVSAILHLAGLTEAHPPGWVLVAAQVVIGVSVGVRFGGFPFLRLLRTLWSAGVQALVTLLISLAAAFATQEITGLSLGPILLAYVPGGAPEMGIVALSLGLDPAYVTVHHLARLALILLAMPFITQYLVRHAKAGGHAPGAP
ncbi:AbrB family transcriptional regulator [Telmatospirillum sp. J64-1]|uniref:AbrB family transcriptional regulator n=1 Tax=Telmatospirillum sp. J64-1 TaxID=2502183 RepID=UPI00115D2DCB|nr:AbrB family transcriptional regulator [Telmatospirillum sp. J64-1]